MKGRHVMGCEHLGVVGDELRVGRYGLRGAWAALAVAAALMMPTSAGTHPVLHQPMIEDGGSGSTACINVVSLRYYLCVRSDGSVYRIYY